MMMPTFDKRTQWQKKHNINVKKMEKENIKIKTIRLEW